MNPGKVSNQILSRSVIKNIKKRREDVISGAGIGKDCAIMKCGDSYTYVTTNPVICGIEYCEHAVYRAVNNIALAGGKATGIMVNITYMRDFNESTLKHIMKKLDKACEELGIQIMGGHTSINGFVKQPVINITGVGTSKELPNISYKAKPGDDIIVTKDIATQGVGIIKEAKKEEILSRYSQVFMDDIKCENADLSIEPEAAVAIKHGVAAMHDISEGGIFSALWDISEACHVGFSVDLKKIPIKQSSIEVCEMFDINPYYLLSGGSLLIIAPAGSTIVNELEDMGIKATIIGRVTDNNDKLIINGDEIRYLDTPKRDEIYTF